MKSRLFTLVFLFAYGLIIQPSDVHAGTYATQIGDDKILFSLSFTVPISFGPERYYPIMVDETVDYFDRVDVAGVAVETASGTAADAQVTALLLSTSPVIDDRYHVASTSTGTITLVAVASFAETITEDYLLRITKLPFWYDELRTSVHENQLAELTTPLSTRHGISH